MIDIDIIEQCINDAVEQGLWNARANLCVSDVFDMIGLLRQSEKDAARYRWLRDDAVEHDLCISVSLESSEWNAFIDEAMKCSGDDK